MFAIIFYIFSTVLSYTDYKKYLVPNNILLTMAIMLLIFGFFESKIYISSIVLSLVVLLFFITLMLINRQMILGGGDIKYMMLVALFLGLKPFAVFLIITGLLQTIVLLFMQKVKKRRVAAMVPVMFISVIIVNILSYLNIFL
ncbi:prepilin peptidase [Arcobacter roscoffensis]|uniref:A24 family peptidase n=1 Tax=Arcobacter roscoffensis TaxID=2961520 RepID=A0ABY5E523_9BACT|nr:A24 family peptidase [Arcobacter roscoffensis]UTJ06238.1 A24 family peptidase [Arcobacter roscoffensis]